MWKNSLLLFILFNKFIWWHLICITNNSLICFSGNYWLQASYIFFNQTITLLYFVNKMSQLFFFQVHDFIITNTEFNTQSLSSTPRYFWNNSLSFPFYHLAYFSITSNCQLAPLCIKIICKYNKNGKLWGLHWCASDTVKTDHFFLFFITYLLTWSMKALSHTPQ